jgi:hypothetical protein
MSAGRYDIYAEQGSTFKLHLQYKYSGGTGIDLSGFTGEIQVRKSEKDERVLLFISDYGVTGATDVKGFIAGSTFGYSGIGGISFNTSISGSTIGATGGINIKVDSETMKKIPSGKHFYDLELTNSIGEVTRLIEGTFEVSREITR